MSYTLSNANVTNLTTVETAVKATMQYMYKSFLNGDNDTNIGLSPLASLSNITAGITDSSPFAICLDYTAFNTKYKPTGGWPALSNATLYSSTASSYTIPNADPASPNEALTINVSNYLVTDPKLVALRDDLDTLKIAYQLCDDKNFYHFVNDPKGMINPATNISINSYIMNPNASGGVYTFHKVNDVAMYGTTAGTNSAGKTIAQYNSSNSLIRYLYTVDPKVVDLFVLRRMILGTYYMLHCRLFLSIYVETYAGSPPTRNELAAKCLSSYFDKLRKLNADYDASMITSGDNTMMATIQDNMDEYNANLVSIDALDSSIRDSKKKLKVNLSTMDKEAKNADASSKYQLAAIVIALLTVVAMVAVLAIPLSTKVKVQTMTGLLALALVSALLLNYFRKQSVKEGFIALAGGQDYSTVLSAITTTADMKAMFNLVILSELNDMYANTIQLAFALKSNVLYNTLNQNQSKELLYFNDSAYQIDAAVKGVDDVGKLHVGKAHISRSVFMFFIQMLFVIAFAVIIVMVTEDLPLFRNIGLSIVAFIALIVVLLFVRSLLTRVRTDPHKMYWGQPEGSLATL
jgi:hypothetical protein